MDKPNCSQGGELPKILVADDSAESRCSLVRFLKDRFAVFVAETPLAAAMLWEKHEFEGLLTDFDFGPGECITGVDLIKVIRKFESNQGKKSSPTLILMSGGCVTTKPDDIPFLPKPLSLIKLQQFFPGK